MTLKKKNLFCPKRVKNAVNRKKSLNYNKYLFNFDNVSPRRYLQISIRTKEAIFRDETG